MVGLPQQISSKTSACNVEAAGEVGLIPAPGRSPGGGQGTPSSVLAWKIPWTAEPGGLQSIGSPRVIHKLKRLNMHA